jgi:hypothetical protein
MQEDTRRHTVEEKEEEKRGRGRQTDRQTDRQKKPITISICVLSSASSLETLRNLKD